MVIAVQIFSFIRKVATKTILGSKGTADSPDHRTRMFSMKSSLLKLLFVSALTATAFQSLSVQSTHAQEKMFGNGRFIKRVFGDLLPQSTPPKPRPSLNALPKPGQQPTLAKRPSQINKPTPANRQTRPRSTDPRSVQPARSADIRATTNRLPKNSCDRQ